jgi:hypothetical protein
MNPSEQFVITRLDRVLHCHGEPLSTDEHSRSEGCFVESCTEPVEWAGWWYGAGGARNLTESCGEHSDHNDFTPVTRFADVVSRVHPF